MTQNVSDLMRKCVKKQWIIRDILPEGLSVLSGKPFIGKSWLALNIVVAVSNGWTVLNRKVERKPVYYFSLLNDERRLQSRLKKIIGNRTLEYDFIYNLSADTSSFFQILDVWMRNIKGERPLIVVDTLDILLCGKTKKVDFPLRALDFSLEHNASILLLTNKYLHKNDCSKLFSNIMDSAIIDTSLMLERKRLTTNADLLINNRYLGKLVYKVRFNETTFLWDLITKTPEKIKELQLV
ncbi:hypothetical protein OMAG_000828 [Candidatus Omnitrophus magneticus]|uniref:Uncharacterized protein n=1 Tax=Candidatus Omnitrophus magneticus TaxID=1609969 RepID=A0A0F0CTF5_9BACT|nr:hypothetical protein OMAG_000828 [Candidatus Omnitrophus magneticus]